MDRSVPVTEADVEGWLTALLEAEYGISPETARSVQSIADLGLDSVEMVSIIGSLEEWLGRPLPDSLWSDFRGIDGLCCRVAGENGSSAVPRGPIKDEAPVESLFTVYVNPTLGRLLESINLGKRFVQGRGTELFDDKGRGYLDFVASYGALPFGHNPPEMWQAVLCVRERDEPELVQPSELVAAGALAERLVGIAPPGIRYATFANSGAEAVEAALKLCRYATGRKGILYCENSFHGKTLGALSATGNPRYRKQVASLAPDFDGIPFGVADALEDALAQRPGHYAAFIVEPIQGEGGIVEPPPGYLARASALCRAAGTLVIADEVQTGLGRTGSLWGSTDSGLVPDVVTLAKALGGGLVPIGACLFSERAASSDFWKDHSSTFGGNTLACRVGLAVIDLLERDDHAVIRSVAVLGARLKRELMNLMEKYPDLIREVRGRGLLLGLRLTSDGRVWPPGVLEVLTKQDLLAPLLSSYLLNVHGVRVAPTLNGSDVIRIEPPLTVSSGECLRLLTALDRTLTVFASGDAGRIIASILAEGELPASAVPKRETRRMEARPQAEDPRFAFLLHPLTPEDFHRLDPSLSSLERGVLRDAMKRLGDLVEPFVVSQTRIVSRSGASAFGEFIVVPRTTEQLLAMSGMQARAEIGKAVMLARERQAAVVGLGAYTSVVSGGGIDLPETGAFLTTGNTYTVVTGCEAIEIALAKLGRRLEGSVVAIVGASGAIGRSLALLLADRVTGLILIGNPARPAAQSRRALIEVAAAAVRRAARSVASGGSPLSETLAARVASLGGAKLADRPLEDLIPIVEQIEFESGEIVLAHQLEPVLPLANVVITATSSPETLVSARHLRAGSVVCDLSRPRNVGEDVRRQRPDVLAIDGGVVEVPGRPSLGSIGLREGFAFACMAETMLLSLERTARHVGLGTEIRLEEMLLLRGFAQVHGFRVAELRSFDRPLEPGDFERVRAAQHARLTQ